MLNSLDNDLTNMAFTKMWVVSQQTDALGSMTESPCCPLISSWWGRAAVPRSWALQTWIEMAKYGIGTNTMLDWTAKPLEHNEHILKCGPTEDEQTVFKWSTHTGVRWLS